jgi:hypothetical protein
LTLPEGPKKYSAGPDKKLPLSENMPNHNNDHSLLDRRERNFGSPLVRILQLVNVRLRPRLSPLHPPLCSSVLDTLFSATSL